jgi:hypothetical protein
MDVTAAADFLGVSPKFVRARISSSQLPSRRLGGRVIFLRAELERFLSGLPGTTADQILERLEQRQAAGA